MIKQVEETYQFLVNKGFKAPEIGIILGTGLGALVDHIDIEKKIPYQDIPHFPIATVEFHQGELIYGELEGKKIIAMHGRFHYYEGYNMQQLTFPVRVMHKLGIDLLLVSNAAGNMNMDWQKGQLMLMTDHINLLPDNPLRGQEASAFGPIFVDMADPYDLKVNEKLRELAKKNDIVLNEGVYAVVQGPNLETRAEYKYLRMIGADVVGMSTVPEVIVANQIGLRVSAVSVLTDDCDPDNLAPVNIQDILNTAKTAEKDLVILIKELLRTS